MAARSALNLVYGAPEQRGFVKLNAISLAMTVGGIVFMVVAAVAVIVLPGALGFAGLPGFTMWIRLSAIVVLAGAEIGATIESGRAGNPSAWR